MSMHAINFSNTVVVNMQVTKESAKKFKENSFAASRSSISFHLQSVEDKVCFPGSARTQESAKKFLNVKYCQVLLAVVFLSSAQEATHV